MQGPNGGVYCWQVLQLARGFRGRSKNCIRIARERVEKALQYAWRDRKAKKRDMRSLWIQRVNAATKELGVSHKFLVFTTLSCAVLQGTKHLCVSAGAVLSIHAWAAAGEYTHQQEGAERARSARAMQLQCACAAGQNNARPDRCLKLTVCQMLAAG